MNTLGITSYMIASRAYSQHDDGGGVGDFRGIVLGYLGYTRVED